MAKRKFKWDNGEIVRCGHRFCRACRTKRGRNWGNRRKRREAKAAIRNEQ